MKRKLLVSMVLSFVFVFAFSAIATATDNTNMTESQFILECEQLGIDSQHIDISDMPEGITPIEYSTWEEAFAAVSAGKDGGTLINEGNVDDGIALYGTNKRSTKMFDSVSITVYANVTGSGTSAIINSVNSINSTCNVYGNTWKETDVNYNFTDGFRTLEGTMYGNMSHYVIVAGIGNVYTESRSVPFYFYGSEFK